MSVRYSILPDMQFLKYLLFFFMIMVDFFCFNIISKTTFGEKT